MVELRAQGCLMMLVGVLARTSNSFLHILCFSLLPELLVMYAMTLARLPDLHVVEQWSSQPLRHHCDGHLACCHISTSASLYGTSMCQWQYFTHLRADVCVVCCVLCVLRVQVLTCDHCWCAVLQVCRDAGMRDHTEGSREFSKPCLTRAVCMTKVLWWLPLRPCPRPPLNCEIFKCCPFPPSLLPARPF